MMFLAQESNGFTLKHPQKMRENSEIKFTFIIDLLVKGQIHLETGLKEVIWLSVILKEFLKHKVGQM